MMASNELGSLLVVDVGSISTRAILFDIVEGKYRYIASGVSPTTITAPYQNISEGIRLALDHLSRITGRKFIGEGEQLIIPTDADGSGVDQFAALVSVGPPIKVVAVGLLADVSLESACNLARTVYAEVGQTICLNDRRKTDERITSIIKLRPDLFVFAGGTENGASQSVLNLLEEVGLACYLMSPDNRPHVLYVGNQAIKKQIKEELDGIANINFAPNIRPALDHEQLDAAMAPLASIYSRLRSLQIPGVSELYSWAKGEVMPNSIALGRVIRYLSKLSSTRRGVLGIDVAASATTIAAAFDGELTLGVYPQYGLGQNSTKLFQNIPVNEVTRWLTRDISELRLHEYVYNKSNYPQSLPVTLDELEIEQAFARAVIHHAINDMSKRFPQKVDSSNSELLPWLDPILATGSVIANAPSLAHSVLMLLDGLQPTGASFLVLDQNHIASALGVSASISPMLMVQVLDSNAFLYMGTVISPVGKARIGTPILRLKIVYSSGHETTMEITYGSLEVLPLSTGQTADLHLQPLHRFDVGMGAAGRGGALRRVMGGALGIVIDARGRPLPIARDHQKRAEFQKKWLAVLGGR